MTNAKSSMATFRKDPVRHIVLPLLVEFVSQFIFTYWGVMTEEPQHNKVHTVENGNRTNTPNDAEKDYMASVFVPSFQSGIAAFSLIILFSKINSAPPQFNPSFTMVLVIVGTVPAILLVPIIAAQCVASTLAAYVAQIVRGLPPAVLVIPDEVSPWSIFVNEVILVAAITMFAAELTQNPNNKDPLGPLAIGIGVFVSLLSGKWIGATCLNPARVFGPVAITGGDAWNRHWIFWIADLLGATCAGIFWLVFLAPVDRSLLGKLTKRTTTPKKEDILLNGVNECKTNGVETQA